jgi:DnaJ-class molecular chaperone
MQCDVCGADLEFAKECEACYGTGTERDPDIAPSGHYVYGTCEWCGGTGEWLVCPNAADAAHEAAYKARAAANAG